MEYSGTSTAAAHLLPVHDLYPGLDVGKVVGRGEDGLALVLLVQVAVGGPVRGERRGEYEAN